MNFYSLAIGVAALMLPGTANAQHALVLDRLNQWNAAAPAPTNDVLKAEIDTKAPEIYRKSGACSPVKATIDKVQPATADRFSFSALIRGSIKNAWFVTTRLSGCDNEPVRFMVTQHRDGTLSTIRVNRGTSYAWESLIGDTFPLALMAAKAALRREKITCPRDQQPTLGGIRLASQEPGLGPDTFGVRYQGSWSEIWPLNTCDRTVEVRVDFTADGDGGAYTKMPGQNVEILKKAG